MVLCLWRGWTRIGVGMVGLVESNMQPQDTTPELRSFPTPCTFFFSTFLNNIVIICRNKGLNSKPL